MRVAVVGGGIVGLFAAWHLEREGADVTLYEEADLGAGSIHAAGIIEPATAYRTNTLSFLRRVGRLWRRGTCAFRRADPHWLLESLRQMEREPSERMEESLGELSASSVAQYRALADERNDFDFSQRGLTESFDDPAHFDEERRLALSRRSTVPVEVRDGGRGAGTLFFPDVGWLHTERFVARMAKELTRTSIVHHHVNRVDLDGTVLAGGQTVRFDATIASTGVSCRRLGVPLTGVRGYGWHARARGAIDHATIYVDSGVAIVPFADGVKVTGGWDFDLSVRPFHTQSVIEAIQRTGEVDQMRDFREGSRPCTPDGLPTVGRREHLVAATGGFRLGWSFAPSMGRHAARLALGQEPNDPFLARFCGTLHSGRL